MARDPRVQAVEERLRKMAAAMGSSWTIELALPNAFAQRKLGWLLDGRAPHQPARPMGRMTPFLRSRVYNALRRKYLESMLDGPDPSMLPAMTVAGYEIRRAFLARWESSGGDARPIAVLSARWLATKRRRGLDSRIGRATNDPGDGLQPNLAKSRVVVTRNR